jgi:hypothetical protein
MKTGRCPSCYSTRIGALECLPEETASYQALGTISYKPTWVQPASDGKTKTARGSTTTTKAGTLEVVLCGRCGRLETYVQDPQWVPFERLRGFSWASVPPTDGSDR